MAPIDDVVRAFAQCEQLFGDIREDLSRLRVGGALWQRLQVADQLYHNLDHRFVMFQTLMETGRRRQRIEICQQIDRRSGRDRPDLEPAFIEEFRSEQLKDALRILQ